MLSQGVLWVVPLLYGTYEPLCEPVLHSRTE